MQCRNKHTHPTPCMHRLQTGTHSPQCMSVLILSFWQGPGDFSNHLRWGGRKIWSAACEGWASSKLIISSQAHIIISQVSPIRECWCGISAQISHSQRFHYRAIGPNPGKNRGDRISRIPQKSFAKRSFAELWRSFQLSQHSFRVKLCCVDFCCVFMLNCCGLVVSQRCSQRVHIKKVPSLLCVDAAIQYLL